MELAQQHLLELVGEVEKEAAAPDLAADKSGLFAELYLVGLVPVLLLVEFDDAGEMRTWRTLASIVQETRTGRLLPERVRRQLAAV